MDTEFDPGLLFIIVNALGGDDIGQMVADDARAFINNPIEQKVDGYLLLQECQIEITGKIKIEDIIKIRSLYFENQFDIITGKHGIVSQIWGDLFVAYWRGNHLNVGELISDLNAGLDKVKHELLPAEDLVKVNKIRSYVDYDTFYLIKNGSSTRFNYTPMGLFYNNCLRVIKELWNENYHRWFVSGSVGDRIEGSDLQPVFKVESNTVSALIPRERSK